MLEKGKEVVRNCLNCDGYAPGCEERCRFELREDAGVKKKTLSKRRRNMKAEKDKAYDKARVAYNSAMNKAEDKYNYSKPKRKQQLELEKELEKLSHGEAIEPKEVFRARKQAAKQAKRKLKRREKNKTNKK